MHCASVPIQLASLRVPVKQLLSSIILDEVLYIVKASRVESAGGTQFWQVLPQAPPAVPELRQLPRGSPQSPPMYPPPPLSCP